MSIELETITELPPHIYNRLTSSMRSHLLISQEQAEVYTSLRRYVEGDNYQSGQGWIGPSSRDDNMREEISRGFVGDDMIRQVVNRHLRSLLGKEPSWSVSDLPTAKVDELVRWWDSKLVYRHIKQSAKEMIWSSLGYLLLYVSEFRPVISSEDALSIIGVQHVSRDSVMLVRDPSTNLPSIVVVRYAPDGLRYKEPYADVYWVEDGLSWYARTGNDFKVLKDEGSPMLVSYDLGGLPLVWVLEEEPIISPATISLQRAIDHATTMLSRNNTLAGFRERIFFNAQEPETPTKVGPNITSYIMGVPIEDEAGNLTQLSNPSVIYKDPVDNSPIIASVEYHRKQLLSSVGQLHVLISGDATASGMSRVQALSDHISLLQEHARAAERAVVWALTSAMRLANHLKPGSFPDSKVIASVRLSVASLQPEERAQIVKEYESRLRSRETTMALLGIDDPDMEKLLIEQELDEDIAGGQSEESEGV